MHRPPSTSIDLQQGLVADVAGEWEADGPSTRCSCARVTPARIVCAVKCWGLVALALCGSLLFVMHSQATELTELHAKLDAHSACTSTGSFCNSAGFPTGCRHDVAFPRASGATNDTLAYDANPHQEVLLSARFPTALGNSAPALFCPSSATGKKLGSVVMLSEWYGVTTATTNIATLLTAAGFDVYVINSYRDHVIPVDSHPDYGTVEGVARVQTASGWKMKTLHWEELAADVGAIVAQLHADKAGPLALMGFSEGAALALLASQNAQSQGLAATVVFYGSPGSAYTGSAPSLFHPGRIDIPLQLTCGDLDHITGFSSCPALQAVKDRMTGAAAAASKMTTYHGVGHGFLNSCAWWEKYKAAQTPPRDRYNPTVSGQAMAEAIAFLRQHLHADEFA